MGVRFGTDGIRGVANAELGAELVLALGRATARALPARTFLVARDTRRSGPLLQAALSAGLASEGADVVDLGVLPTPGVAWHCASRRLPGAVISASHNPFADNGVKLFATGGLKLPDAAEAAVEEELDRVLRSAVRGPRSPTGHAVGRLSSDPDAADGYVEHLVAALEGRSLEGMRVVVDCANGAASSIAPVVLERLGATVDAIACEPDGTNINDGCGSTHPERVGAAVVASGAAVGLALDGDADRLVAVDHTGDGHHRGRAPGPLRHRPGRARTPGRQHRGGDGHVESRFPPGHGREGDRRPGDTDRRPVRPRGAERRRV